MRITAIDPGNEETAIVQISDDYRPTVFAKVDNYEALFMLERLQDEAELLGARHYFVIEQVAHYGTGMPAGKTIFDTCVWIGRYKQTIADLLHVSGAEAEAAAVNLVPRKEYVLQFCRTTRAGDPNVIQYLADRFAPGETNHGKGTKKAPGWFYGFKADVWQAYALAVYELDRRKNGKEVKD